MHKRVQAYTKLNCCYHCCVSLDFYCLLLFFSFYLTFTLLLPGKRQLLASFVSFCNGMGGLEDPRLLCSSACMIIHLSNFVEHQLLTDGHRHDNNKYHSAMASLNRNYETNSWCGELPLNRCICMCKYACSAGVKECHRWSKAHTSAVVVIPPETCWPQIQDIRRLHFSSSWIKCSEMPVCVVLAIQ